MSSKLNQTVAVGILDFLNTAISNGSISSDDVESVQVAVDCISEVFNVTTEDKPKLLGNESLASIVEKYQAGASSTATAAASAAATANSSATATPADTASSTATSEDDKKEAEKLKVEGNRFMAQRNFDEAVNSYTRAISKDPSNAIYYSNRSAAYSSLRKSDEAAEDARKAIEIDPTYSKAYSRLGLALYSLGDAQGAMEAYQRGIQSEGDSPSDGMKKGYETAKKRVEEDLEASVPTETTTRSVDDESAAAAPAPGGFDFSALGNMFGGAGGGGMPNISQLMNDPTISQMAQNLMSNPSALSGLMNNPALQRMRESAQSGQMPSMGDLMSDPSLQDLARSFLGGAGGAGGAPPGGAGADSTPEN